MMKVITGEIFETSAGTMIIYNEQQVSISVGEKIVFNNDVYLVKEIIPPSNPHGKWSLRVVS